MNKTLRDRAIAYNNEIKDALLTIFNELNNGQQKKILRNEKVHKLFVRYHIIEEDE